MRRAALLATLLLPVLLVAALTGCGSSSSARAGGSAAAPSSSGGPEQGVFPVTIEHEFGATTVKAEPKRVVVVGLVEQDALLALGVVPVAVTEWFGNAPGRIFPWAKAALGSAAVPAVLPTEKEFEKVAALKPDLIVGLYSGMKKQDYDLLSAIAPTIAHAKGENDYSIAWQEATETIGKAVGKPAEAARLVAGVEAKFAEARQKYPQFQGKQAVMVTPYEGIFVYGPKDPRGRVLAELGFVFPPGLADVGKSEFGTSISAEQTKRIDVDALVWLDSEAKVTKALPTYAGTAVAKGKHAVYIAENDDDPFYVATSFVTVLSLPYLLDGLLPKLAAAVAGS